MHNRDPQGMLDLVFRLPEFCAQAWMLGRDVTVPAHPSSIAVIGMGGSGIGGDLLRTLLAEDAPVPVAVVKDYRLPAFVDRAALVFACSYSGNTEETLAAYDEASARGAACVVITSGGALRDRAAERGHPTVVLPPGLPPRAALPYVFLPMVSALSGRGIIPSMDAAADEAAAVVESVLAANRPDASSSRARALAESFYRRIPVIYSATPFLEPAAQRWKDQLNENAKTFAVWNTFPELNHNETVGWGVDPSLAAHLAVVILHDPQESDRLRARVAITKDLAFRAAGSIDEVTAEGSSRLARLLSIIAVGDLASVELAYRREVDPTPVTVIEALKQRLAAQQ